MPEEFDEAESRDCSRLPINELTDSEIKDEIARLEDELATPNPVVRLDELRLENERRTAAEKENN